MPIPSGAYDPSPAVFYHFITEVINGEPVVSPRVFCKTYIRFPYLSRHGTENVVAKQVHSVGQLLVRVRKNSKTKQIDPSMEFVHNGQHYGIICISPVPSVERDEIELLVQYKVPSKCFTQE